MLSRVCACATRRFAVFSSCLVRRFCCASCWASVSSMPASSWSYQAPRVPNAAAWLIRPRYSRTPVITTARRSAGEKPRSRPRISRLAASRLTSHSHGPGSVSSKSLMSKSMRRSGVPKRPKFDRCASPHSCTVTPDTGVGARSAAMIVAAPRKKVKGERSIRPLRIGMSSATRSFDCSSRSVTGSGRSAAGSQRAWADLGALVRASLPLAMRCSAVRRARRHDAPKCSLSVPAWFDLLRFFGACGRRHVAPSRAAVDDSFYSQRRLR